MEDGKVELIPKSLLRLLMESDSGYDARLARYPTVQRVWDALLLAERCDFRRATRERGEAL